MLSKLDELSRESVLLLHIAVNFSGEFSNTKRNQILKQCIASGFSPEKLRLLVSGLDRAVWQRAQLEYERARRGGVEILCPLSEGYPQSLRQLSDPPACIFLRGAPLDFRFAIAVVGARNCSEYGRRVSAELAREVVCCGGTVISGLAYGVDEAAHEGALAGWASLYPRELSSSGGGKSQAFEFSPTVAVLGSGVERIYPSTSEGLAERILQSGGSLISEYGIDEAPRKYFFPRRNRLIAALSARVVVVEAKARSGSLITARLAMEQGKEVAVVPGRIDQPLAEGANALLRDGALVIAQASDVVYGVPGAQRVVGELGLSRENSGKGRGLAGAVVDEVVNAPLAGESSVLAAAILEVLGREGELSFDQLVEVLRCEPGDLAKELIALELIGGIARVGAAYMHLNANSRSGVR